MLEDVFDSLAFRIVGFVAMYVWFVWLMGRMPWYALSWRLRGPLSWPLFGDMPAAGYKTIPCDALNRLVTTYKAPVRLWLGMDLAVIMSEAEDFEEMLYVKHLIRKPMENDPLLALMDEGVSVGTGIEWSMIRCTLDPSFTPQMLRAYQPFYEKYSRLMCETMQKDCDGGLVDINAYMLRFSGDVICDTLFEEKFNFYSGQHDDVLAIPSRVLESMAEGVGFCNPLFEYDVKKHQRARFAPQLKAYRDFFHDALNKHIDEYIVSKKTENEYNVEDPEPNELYKKTSGRSLFQELMIRMASGMLTRKQIIDSFDNIYVQGVDIVGTQLSLFVLVMALYKHIQGVLYEEISKYYKDDMEAEVKQSDFEHLPYLDMCVKEVMRLFPSTVVSYRTSMHEVPWEKRKMAIPPKTVVMLSFYSLHRNPKYWEDPDEFVPERFSKEEEAKRPRCAYFPLGGGVRNCLGQFYGVDMMKTAIIHLMRKFEFNSNSNFGVLKTKNDVRVRSAQGYQVFIKNRA